MAMTSGPVSKNKDTKSDDGGNDNDDHNSAKCM